MKSDERDLIFEKYFNFFKMDKKNVQNRLVQKGLTDRNFRLDKEKLWSPFKPYFFIL